MTGVCVVDGCDGIAQALGKCNSHYHVERRARLAAQAAVGPLDDLEVPPAPGGWVEQAACRGLPTDWWFSERGRHDVFTAGQAVCDACPVRQDCLDYALDHGIKHGVWGGKSEKQRRLIRREIRGVA